MIRLAYASTAKKDWGSAELLSLLQQCRKNNSANGISGILLYSNRTFFQILEGDEEVVESTYETIKQDERHKDVTLIEKKDILERDFPYWSMGFPKLNKHDLDKIEGLEDVYKNDFNPTGLLAKKSVLSPLMKLLKNKLIAQVSPAHEELPLEHEDPFIQVLHKSIRLAVKFLALLILIVIVLGVIDVLYVIASKVLEPPYFLLTINDMLTTFGSFLAVLIAIEIFLNITIYIRSDVIPVKLVVATALMAISRKVIVFDFKNLEPEYVAATSLVVLSLGITYWLIDKKTQSG